MQRINMIMIYYWDKRNGGHMEHASQKYIIWVWDIKSMFV